MSISTIIRQHRANNALTQQELAAELGVSLMTISRLESGKPITLSNAMIVKLNDLLDEDDFSQLNPDDPEESKLFAYHNGKLHVVRKKQFVVGSEAILDDMDALADRFYFEPDSDSNFAEHGRVYTRVWNGGDWLVSMIYAVDELNSKDESEYCRHIEETIPDAFQKLLGYVCMNSGIKKLSFFVPEEFSGYVASLLRSAAPCLSICDVSVIGYQNRPCHFPYSELDVFLNEGAGGFFQLDTVSGKEEFVNWKMALQR